MMEGIVSGRTGESEIAAVERENMKE